jgi:hypothetical protein
MISFSEMFKTEPYDALKYPIPIITKLMERKRKLMEKELKETSGGRSTPRKLGPIKGSNPLE